MTKLLAKAKIQSLDFQVLRKLVQADMAEDGLALQDHLHIEGSMEERMCQVRTAFRAWRKATGNENYYCGTILGIFEDSVLYCADTYPYDGPFQYYSIGISGEGDGVALSGTPTPMDVKMVATTLNIAEGATEAQAVEEPEDSMQTKEVQAGDAVVDDAVVETTKPVGHSDDNLVPPAPTTAAETPGVAVPDPSVEATSNSGVEKSDDIPVGPVAADGSTSGAVHTAMGKVAAGVKQELPAVQSRNYDLADQSMSFVTLQSVEERPDGTKLMHIQGIATRGDIVNGAGEVYPLTVWEQNMPKMNELAGTGKFLGKLEHPGVEQGLVDAAIKYDKFWLQGADVMFEAVVIPTEPHGKNLQALIEAGVQVDMSSRGYGNFVQSDWRGSKRKVMQNDFVCTAFDAVWHGASTGSGVKEVTYQSDPNPQDQGEAKVETKVVEVQAAPTAADRAAALRAKTELQQTRVALVQQSGLNEVGLQAYEAGLAECQDLETMIAKSDALLPALQAVFPVPDAKQAEVVQASTYTPTFFVKQSQEEIAPKTVGELFRRMVSDLPDHWEGQSAAPPGIPNHFTSPREACYQVLCNIARENRGTFIGRDAALGLLALEQGKIDRAQDILTQSLATGSTVSNGNEAGNGAPLSAPLIFALVRRVFPMYIMNEIASVQPMDRPQGKIFFLDQYRTEDPAGYEKRIDLNTSANPFNSSYADNDVEDSAAHIIRLRLASETIDAHTKKLGAAWSIEEMQDLRAYHGLDAAVELMGGVSREMALEWNKEVLDDMIAQGTACDLVFGKTIPTSGFDQQKDWDEYLWVYLTKMDNDIFARRNGPMTHLIVGVDAALSLSKSMRGVFTIGGANGGEMEGPYPGTTFYGMVNTPNGGRYRILKTNFWGSGTANASKIMGIRKGSEWSDTPYVWAPYTDYVTPLLTDPADFSQKQGIVSRAGKKVVVSDAIGVLTVDSSRGELL